MMNTITFPRAGRFGAVRFPHTDTAPRESEKVSEADLRAALVADGSPDPDAGVRLARENGTHITLKGGRVLYVRKDLEPIPTDAEVWRG